jgi:WD40 repeat protein
MTTGVRASVILSPTGKRLASSAAPGSVHVWDAGTFRLLKRFGESDGHALALSYADDRIALGTLGKPKVTVWDLANDRHVGTLDGDGSVCFSGAFSPDGRILATGDSEGGVRTWDIDTGRVIRKLEGHGPGTWVNSVAFSPKGDTLASADLRGGVFLWEVDSGRPLATIRGHEWCGAGPIAFTSDGEDLVLGCYHGAI